MKKFILRSLLFFVIVSLVDFGFGEVCRCMVVHAKSGANKQLVDLCERDNYDILIMGSSKAHHNYIPKVFVDSLGMTCYNAGYDGNGVILAYAIIKMINKERQPKLILYDVKQQFDIYHYEKDGDYTRYYKILKPFYGKPVVDSIISSINTQELFKLQSSLYRNNGEFFNYLLGVLKDSREDNLGYVPATGLLTNGKQQRKDYEDKIDSLKISYFKKFVKYVKERNINMIVVISPEYNTPFADDFQPIREICINEGVTVYDYFEDPYFQQIEYYKDHCHLNKDGAKLFSEMLVTKIKMNR